VAPDAETRWAGLAAQEGRFYYKIDPKDLAGSVSAAFEKKAGCDPAKITELKERFLKAPHPGSFSMMQEIGPNYSCGVFGNPGCKETFSDLMNHMNVVDFYDNELQSHPEATFEVITDKSYVTPLQNLVKIMGDKVNLIHSGKKTDAGDFYQDLKAAFALPEIPKARQSEMLWNFIKLYSS